MSTNRVFKFGVLAVLLFHNCVFANMGRMGVEIVSIKVDSAVTLGSPLTIEFCAATGFPAENVIGKIVPQEGFAILVQPSNTKDSLGQGDSVFFVGRILPNKLGTWKVEVGANYFDGYGTERFSSKHFYIHLSDTLNRTFTSMEYLLLPKGRAYAKPTKKLENVKPIEHFRQSKPWLPDSTKPRSHSNREPAGTFDLIGGIVWHDPRDPSGWERPAPNLTVIAWNENEHDPDPWPDEELGRTITDEYGQFAFYGLDSWDSYLTADPYVTFSTNCEDLHMVKPSYPYTGSRRSPG